MAIAFGVLVLLIVGLASGLIWSIRPSEPLDLAYERISISSKIRDMVLRRSFELRLTEADLNNIMKKELAERADSIGYARIDGARFEQQGRVVTAHVQATGKAGIRAEASLDFELKWSPPNLIVEHIGTKTGPWAVPIGWFKLDPIRVPIDEQLPIVSISTVKFESNEIIIAFQLK